MRTTRQMTESWADQRLVHAARIGEATAFPRLVERHYAALVGSCLRMLGDRDAARDAAQEAVLRAMLGLDHLRDDARFGAWLVGIGLNVCRGLLAQPVRQEISLDAVWAEGGLNEPAAEVSDAIDMVASDELSSRVRLAITGLPAGQREAVALFYFGGLTQAEIAEEIGTRPGAVKTRLHKARGSLRASLLDTYKEYIDMTDQTAQLIPMHVAELRRTAGPETGGERHIVFLEDDGGRRLPIWIGTAEATALAVTLEDVQLPRPGVYQFAAALLEGAGSRLREVRVTELTEATFYAKAVLSDGTSIDARPSDALTLALLTNAPIYVAAPVLDRSDRNQAAFSDLIEQADAATDDAHVIAEEVRASHASSAAELAARENRTA
jgi:RNA polymerase sigma factor (sigma-70 family)